MAGVGETSSHTFAVRVRTWGPTTADTEAFTHRELRDQFDSVEVIRVEGAPSVADAEQDARLFTRDLVERIYPARSLPAYRITVDATDAESERDLNHDDVRSGAHLKHWEAERERLSQNVRGANYERRRAAWRGPTGQRRCWNLAATLAVIGALVCAWVGSIEWSYHHGHPHGPGPSGYIAVLGFGAAIGFVGVAFLVWIIARPWPDGSAWPTRNAFDDVAD